MLLLKTKSWNVHNMLTPTPSLGNGKPVSPAYFLTSATAKLRCSLRILNFIRKIGSQVLVKMTCFAHLLNKDGLLGTSNGICAILQV